MCDRTFTTLDVVYKFIGDIVPCGDSCVDYARRDNLRVALWVVDNLLAEITQTANGSDSHISSVRKSGELAVAALAGFRETIGESGIVPDGTAEEADEPDTCPNCNETVEDCARRNG